MTTKRFPIYQDILNLILLYLIIMSMDMTLSSGMQFEIVMAEYIGIAAVVFASYLFREHITKMYIYAICHALMIALCIIVPIDITSKVKVVFIAIIFCIFDIYNWFNSIENTPDVFWGTGGLILLAFILSSGEFEFGYSVKIFNMGVLFTAFVLVRMLLSNFYDLSRSGQLTDDMPVRELFRNNALIAIGIIVLAIAFMIFVKTDSLIRRINELVYYLLTRFWNFIAPYVTEEDGSLTPGSRRTQMPDLPEMGDGIIAQLIRIMEALMSVMITALIIYFIVKCLISLIQALSGNRSIMRRSHRTYRVKNEVRERLSRTEAVSKNRSGFIKTNTEKVRHIYKKELLYYKKSGVSVTQTHTPRENEREISDSRGRDISMATGIYEKVRFCTGYEATKQDVANIRKGFKI